LLTGNIEEQVEEFLNTVFLTTNKVNIQRPKNRKMPVIREYSAKKQVEKEGKQKRSVVELSILGKLKTCLKDI